MANKRRPTQPAPPAADRTIQYIGIAVAVLVIGFFAWQYIPKPQQALQAPLEFTGEIGTTPACDIFDSIPAASQYDTAPPQLVEETRLYFATFKMAKGGEFVAVLYPDRAPIT